MNEKNWQQTSNVEVGEQVMLSTDDSRQIAKFSS